MNRTLPDAWKRRNSGRAAADNPKLAADCQTLFTFATEDMQSSEALSLEVGDEITDEYREQMDELISQLEEPRPADRRGAGRP